MFVWVVARRASDGNRASAELHPRPLQAERDWTAAARERSSAREEIVYSLQRRPSPVGRRLCWRFSNSLYYTTSTSTSSAKRRRQPCSADRQTDRQTFSTPRYVRHASLISARLRTFMRVGRKTLHCSSHRRRHYCRGSETFAIPVIQRSHHHHYHHRRRRHHHLLLPAMSLTLKIGSLFIRTAAKPIAVSVPCIYGYWVLTIPPRTA